MGEKLLQPSISCYPIKKGLGVPPDAERWYTLTYASLVSMLKSKHGMLAENAYGKSDPVQLSILTEETLPILDDFLSRNPNETKVRESYDLLRNKAAGSYKAARYPDMNTLDPMDPVRHFLKAEKIIGKLPEGSVSLDLSASFVLDRPSHPPTRKLASAFSMPNCHLVFDVEGYPDDYNSLKNLELMLRAYINSTIGSATNQDRIPCQMDRESVSQLKITGHGLPIPAWVLGNGLYVWVIGSDIIQQNSKIWITLGTPIIDTESSNDPEYLAQYIWIMQGLLNGYKSQLFQPFNTRAFPLPKGLEITPPLGLEPGRNSTENRKQRTTPSEDIKNPIMVLLAGIVFYAFGLYGLFSGSVVPKEGSKTIFTILQWIPSLAILFACRKLKITVIITLLLAFIGPSIATWLMLIG